MFRLLVLNQSTFTNPVLDFIPFVPNCSLRKIKTGHWVILCIWKTSSISLWSICLFIYYNFFFNRSLHKYDPLVNQGHSVSTIDLVFPPNVFYHLKYFIYEAFAPGEYHHFQNTKIMIFYVIAKALPWHVGFQHRMKGSSRFCDWFPNLLSQQTSIVLLVNQTLSLKKNKLWVYPLHVHI